MSGPCYDRSDFHKYEQNKREPSVPVAFSISVLSHDRKSKIFSSCTADPFDLRPNMHQTKIAKTQNNTIKLAFLNIRSLKNKKILINDLITINNLNFMFLNETCCSATVLKETAPPKLYKCLLFLLVFALCITFLLLPITFLPFCLVFWIFVFEITSCTWICYFVPEI